MTLPRLVDGDERAGALLRSARELRVPTAPTFESVLQPRVRRRRSRALIMALVAVGPLLAFAASSAGLRALLNPTPTVPDVARVRVVPSPVVSPSRPEQAPRVETLERPAEVPPAPKPPKPLEARERSVHPSAPRPAAEVVVVEPKPAPRSTLGAEARALAEALESSRAGNFQQTVSLLAAYRTRFPSAVLLPEAVVAEARAERALHHRAGALAALDRLDEEASAKHPELLVLRGELLAEQGECEHAVAPLERALVLVPAGALLEQTQFTRLQCAVTLGEPNARERVEAFLATWPNGPFAARANGLLTLVR